MVTEAQARATAKYNKSKYEQIVIRLPKGERDRMQAHADLMGEKQAEFFRRAIAETIARDRAKIREAMKNTPKETEEE